MLALVFWKLSSVPVGRPDRDAQGLALPGGEHTVAGVRADGRAPDQRGERRGHAGHRGDRGQQGDPSGVARRLGDVRIHLELELPRQVGHGRRRGCGGVGALHRDRVAQCERAGVGDGDRAELDVARCHVAGAQLAGGGHAGADGHRAGGEVAVADLVGVGEQRTGGQARHADRREADGQGRGGQTRAATAVEVATPRGGDHLPDQVIHGCSKGRAAGAAGRVADRVGTGPWGVGPDVSGGREGARGAWVTRRPRSCG